MALFSQKAQKPAGPRAVGRRVVMEPMTPEELAARIADAKDADLHDMYVEMRQSAKDEPEARAWYVPWKAVVSKTGQTVGEAWLYGPAQAYAAELGFLVYEGVDENVYDVDMVAALGSWAFQQPGVFYLQVESGSPETGEMLQRLGFKKDETVQLVDTAEEEGLVEVVEDPCESVEAAVEVEAKDVADADADAEDAAPAYEDTMYIIERPTPKVMFLYALMGMAFGLAFAPMFGQLGMFLGLGLGAVLGYFQDKKAKDNMQQIRDARQALLLGTDEDDDADEGGESDE